MSYSPKLFLTCCHFSFRYPECRISPSPVVTFIDTLTATRQILFKASSLRISQWRFSQVIDYIISSFIEAAQWGRREYENIVCIHFFPTTMKMYEIKYFWRCAKLCFPRPEPGHWEGVGAVQATTCSRTKVENFSMRHSNLFSYLFVKPTITSCTFPDNSCHTLVEGRSKKLVPFCRLGEQGPSGSSADP